MCLSIKVDHPELVLATGEHLGYEWVVVKANGHRCGYVRVPKGHPWHGLDYADVPATVHGGLTFGEPDKPCHRDRPDDAYWFGFDCAHAGDRNDPELMNDEEKAIFDRWPRSGIIRDQAYVESECRSLCQQAYEAVNNPIINSH